MATEHKTFSVLEIWQRAVYVFDHVYEDTHQRARDWVLITLIDSTITLKFYFNSGHQFVLMIRMLNY